MHPAGGCAARAAHDHGADSRARDRAGESCCAIRRTSCWTEVGRWFFRSARRILAGREMTGRAEGRPAGRPA